MAHRPANIERFDQVAMGKSGDDRYAPSSSTTAMRRIAKATAARLEMSRISVAWQAIGPVSGLLQILRGCCLNDSCKVHYETVQQNSGNYAL